MTAEEVVNMIIEDYMTCPNIMEYNEKLYCHTWYRHDDCERLRELLFKITNDSKYTDPGAVAKLVKAPNS